MSHLLYFTGQKHSYIGYCEYGAKHFLEQTKPVKIKQVSQVTVLFNPKMGGETIFQLPISADNRFKEDMWINPQNITDVREMADFSKLVKGYETGWANIRAQNSGISLVKKMPGNLPPRPDFN